MVFNRFAGCVLKGPDADLPAHDAKFTEYTYESTDIGKKYYNNGTAWVLLQGPERAETLKNKIIEFGDNTINGVLRDPFSMNKRFGYIIPALTADASLNLALKGLPSVLPGGGYSLFDDPIEGYVSRFSSSAIEQFGWYSSVLPIITRRAYNPYLKIRMRTSTISNMACWVGFSSLGIQAVGNSPLPPLAHGLIMGGGNGFSAVHYVVRNDGGNDAGAHVSTGVSRDTAFHTLEMFLSDSGAPTVTFDGTPVVIPNSRLPGLNTDLLLYIHYWSRDTVAKNFDVARGYFESDII